MQTAAFGEAFTLAFCDHLRRHGGPVPEGHDIYLTSLSVDVQPSSLTRLDASFLVSPGRQKSCRPWIAVKERLPEDDGAVLVCRDGNVHLGACDETGKFVRYDTFTKFQPQPTHWMPLPAAV